MDKKIMLDGRLFKQLREKKALSLDYVTAAAAQEGTNLSKSSLQRLEKNSEYTCKSEVGFFLSRVLGLPPAVLFQNDEISSKHELKLNLKKTGAELLESLFSSEGISINIIGEPDEAIIRESFIKFNKHVQKQYGLNAWNQKAKHKYLEGLDKIEREYELREFIDCFDDAGYKVYSNFFFRYEPFLDVDYDGCRWMGPINQDDLDDLAKGGDPYEREYPITPEGYWFRIILQITICKNENEALFQTVDYDPASLSKRNWRKFATFKEYLLTSADEEFDPLTFLLNVREERDIVRDEEWEITQQMEASEMK